jgi:hypothetical protein
MSLPLLQKIAEWAIRRIIAKAGEGIRTRRVREVVKTPAAYVRNVDAKLITCFSVV